MQGPENAQPDSCSAVPPSGVSPAEGGRGLDSLSDAELIASHLASGENASAWVQELFRRHYAKVVLWCLRMAGEREEARDLAQSVFAKAHRHLASFRGESSISTWLYTITRSECMNYLRGRGPRPSAMDDGLLEEVPGDPAASPDEALERAQSVRLARALLERELTETEKLVFTLHYGDDVPLDSITRLLGLANRSGAKAFIVSARRKLARAIARWTATQERLNS